MLHALAELFESPLRSYRERGRTRFIRIRKNAFFPKRKRAALVHQAQLKLRAQLFYSRMVFANPLSPQLINKWSSARPVEPPSENAATYPFVVRFQDLNRPPILL